MKFKYDGDICCKDCIWDDQCEQCDVCDDFSNFDEDLYMEYYFGQDEVDDEDNLNDNCFVDYNLQWQIDKEVKKYEELNKLQAVIAYNLRDNIEIGDGNIISAEECKNKYNFYI